jgi:prepilin-type N-terminal cleavage/methylation domain-containing protein
MAGPARSLHQRRRLEMGFSLLEISIVMACISLVGYLIADNIA